MASSTSKFTFSGSQGDALDARLDLPVGEPRAFALFAHCFTCGKDIAAASRISRGLVDEGIAVLRFDFTGLGSSEGEFANTNFTSNVADLVAGAEALAERHDAPALLIGHSLGGAAVLAAAPQIASVRGVVTLAAPSEPAHVAGVFSAESVEEIERDGEAEVSLAGRPFRIRQQFLEDISQTNIEDAVAGLDAALLVLHSPIDELVGVDHARRIYEMARHPKSFVSIDGADHLLTDRADAAYVTDIVAAWSRRYLPEGVVDTQAPPEGVVLVEEAGEGTFTQAIHAGNHTLAADEPAGIGDDTGPNPYELLLAGLGACTSMTLRMYADRKGWPLDHVEVRLTHERTHSEDCADPDDAPCRIEVIDRVIEVRGDLTADQVDSLTAIADKCPVHRTLESDLRVTTTMSSRKH